MFLACVALALSALALAATPSDAAVQVRGAVPHSYSYSLQWSSRERVLRGRGGIRVENRGPDPIRSFWLRLRPNDPTRLERITNIRGARANGHAAGGSMLRLRLSHQLAPGERASVHFELRLSVPRENTSLGRSAGTDLFGDALPVVAVAGPRGLRIGPEPSYGEGSFNEVADWTVSLSLPARESALLPGLVRNGASTASPTSHTYLATGRLRDFAFAIGNLSSVHESVDGVGIEVAGSPALRGQLRSALRRTVNAYKKMQQWYGGYNLHALRVVLGDLPFGGSEYPGLVFSTPDNATIAHEVAHQWFYGLVGNDQYNDPFLDESLTAFAEQRFHKSYRCNLADPINGHAHGLGIGMSYWEKHPTGYQDTIYRGGACALTVLRNEIGAAAFDEALRAYVSANANKIAGVEDFLAAIRKAAPGYYLEGWQRLVGLD
jgi:hypothetical protein